MSASCAYLAGGCFWGIQDLFRQVAGVIEARVGYLGGDNDNPTYENHPGHAEGLEIKYDPSKTSLEEFERFWPAEEYHQNYLIKNPGGYTCHSIRTKESFVYGAN